MKVIAAYSVKGGVGKTSAAVNLAANAAASGLRVLVWDLDAQGAATFLLRAKPKVKGGTADLIRGQSDVRKAVRRTEAGIGVLPAEPDARDLEILLDASKKSAQRISRVLAELREDVDVVILDVPPGASLLAENVLRASDVVVVPLHPSALSLRALEQVDAIVGESPRPPRIVGFLSMVDRRRSAHRSAVERLPAERGDIAPIVVPASVVVERMGEVRAPVSAFAPRSEAAAAYAALWAEVARAAGLGR